jgi:arylsulfatase A-like enzyme
MRTDRPTLAGAFRDAGYRTGYVGKWHLDGRSHRGNRLTFDAGGGGFVPPGERRAGYEFWRGFNDGHAHHDGHPRFTREGDPYRERPDEYQPTVQTDVVADFLERNREEPFFCFLSWGPPHPPFEAPGDYADRYDAADVDLAPNVPEEIRDEVRENCREYYGMITSLDDELDRLLGRLDRLGLAEDTVVVFASDHGEYMGAHGEVRGKGEEYEESIRVPLLVRGPGVESRVSPAPVTLVDCMPTLLGRCDLPIPERVQGRDLSGHLRGETGADDLADAVYLQGRLGGVGWRAVRTERYLFSVDRHLAARHLFDLAEDPYQQRDLVEERPDLVTDLRERLVTLAERHDDHQILSEAFRIGTPWGPDL